MSHIVRENAGKRMKKNLTFSIRNLWYAFVSFLSRQSLVLSCRAAKAPRPSNGTLLMWPPLWWPCLPKIDSGGPELPLTDGTFHLGSAPLCSVTFIQGYKNTVLVLQSKLKYYLQVISEVRHSDNIWWNKNAYWTCKKSPVAIIGQSDGKICITIQVVVIQTIIKEGSKCGNG